MFFELLKDHRGVRSSLVGIALVLALALLIPCGCGKDDGEEEPQETEMESAAEQTTANAVNREYFAGWLKHASRGFELRYPQIEEIHNRIEGIGHKCDTIAMFNAMFFQTRPPEPIYMMIFPNRLEAEELYGRSVPFASGDTIVYELFAPLGIAVTEMMIERVKPGGSKYDFVNEGLPTLLDFSGQNYHQVALNKIESGEIIPMADLVDNDKYRKLPKQLRREQAASFLGYLSYSYGPKPIVALIRQDISVDGILRLNAKLNLASLEQSWKKDLPRLATVDAQETQP